MKNSKIIIAGCGYSGSLTALSLAKAGNEVTILEKQKFSDLSKVEDTRATALSANSIEFFKKIGIFDQLSDIMQPINDIYVVDNKSEDMIHFGRKELENHHKMGYLVHNMEFKQRLLDLVENNPMIKIIDDISYDTANNNVANIEVSLSDGQNIKTDLLIACDGFKSQLKEKYFSKRLAVDYNQDAITFTVEHEKDHQGTAVEHFLPSGPFAILPLRDKNTSSIVWTIKRQVSEAFKSLDESEFFEIMKENFGEFLGEVKIISKAKFYPLRAYTTKSYFNKSVILIADTAHVIHPLAGQGLNQGIKDIESITRLLSGKGSKEYILEQYQSERMNDNQQMFRITDSINSIFTNNSKLLKMGRKIAFKAIERVNPLKKLIVRYAMGRR